MTERPDAEAVSRFIITRLQDNPVGASTRFTLAEDLLDKYPFMQRDDARSLISRALATLQDQGTIQVLRAEHWDLSGDERVRLA